MKFAIDVKGLDEALEAANRLADSIRPEVMNLWAKTVENTAKRLCNDTPNNIEFKHSIDKQLKFGYKDEKSKQCLLRAIDTHLNSIPPLLQGFYRKLAEDIRAGKFNP